jgi:hypothetical protein
MNKSHPIPVKHINEFNQNKLQIPNKINHPNFFSLPKLEEENKNIKRTHAIVHDIANICFELFIHNHIKTYEDIEKFHRSLKQFLKDIEKENITGIFFKNYGRQIRINSKKYFRSKDKNMELYLDLVIYLTKDLNLLRDNIKIFIKHIELFYL